MPALRLAKLGLLVLWIASAAAWVVPDGPLAFRALRFVAPGLTVAHLLELPIFLPVLKRAEGKMAHHVVQVLLFGVVHWMDVKIALAEASGDESVE